MLLAVLVLGIIAVAGFFIFTSIYDKPEVEIKPVSVSQTEETEEVKAAFAIFTNGTLRVFTAPMYYNLSSGVYIEAANPNKVNVKKSDITWDDFFKTLPLKLTKNCLTTGTGQTFCTNDAQSLKFYINSQVDADALDRKIKAGDQLLVSYGNKNDTQIGTQLEHLSSIR